MTTNIQNNDLNSITIEIMMKEFCLRSLVWIPNQNGIYIPFSIFGLPIIILNPDKTAFLLCKTGNDKKIKVSDLKTVRKESIDDKTTAILFEIEPKDKLIYLQFNVNDKLIYKRMPVIELQTLSLNTILEFIDKIHTKISRKPTADSMLRGIYDLYRLLEIQPEENSRSYWEKIINDSKTFSEFWEKVKIFLHQIYAQMNAK